MKKLHLLLVLALLLSLACRLTPATTEGEDLGCAAAVEGIRSLWAQYPFPDYFMEEKAVERGGEFDPMLYFTVLDHLSMEAGYVLDFVYTYDFMGGFPTLFARPETQPPYLSWDTVPAESFRALDYVRTDGTAAGYLQLAILSIMGEQFYLFWPVLIVLAGIWVVARPMLPLAARRPARLAVLAAAVVVCLFLLTGIAASLALEPVQMTPYLRPPYR